MKKSFTVTAIDLFCGAGGLSLGLLESGIKIRAGIDLDTTCRFSFEHNIRAPFIHRDVADVSAGDLVSLYGRATVRVMAACAPCQPFSGYTAKNRSSDQRWKLLREVLRLAQDARPEVITVENVSRLAKLDIWSEFVEGLIQAGYHIDWRVIDSSMYEVPQRRHRLVLLASLLGRITIPEPQTFTPLSVRSAIGNLTPIGPGKQNSIDPLHVSRALTEPNLVRIQHSKPAGTWREWPEQLRAECHRKGSGRTYPSVYGRMSWAKPSPTITTQFYGFGNGRFGHPDQDRAITLREGALLQSFPASFEFFPKDERVNFRAVGRLIGNAVPPKLAFAIGKQIIAHAAESLGSGSLNPSSSR